MPKQSQHGIVLVTTDPTYKAEGKAFKKTSWCLFCNEEFIKLPRHLQTAHKQEAEVEALMKLPKRSKEKDHALALLKNRGNYHHNMEVVKKGSGLFMVTRRPPPGQQISHDDYVPCPQCFEFLQKQMFKRHVKEGCQKKKEFNSTRKLRQEAESMMLEYRGISQEM